MLPRRILRWASYHVGNRGVAAFIIGVLWTLIGISMLLDANTQYLPDSILPTWLRSLFWIVPGAYAMGWQLATPMWKHDDHNVWGALMLGPSARFFTYLAASVMDMLNIGPHDDTGHVIDYRGTVIGMLVWLAVIALIDRCAVGLDRLPPERIVGGSDDGVN
jgi:hypothetical protein